MLARRPRNDATPDAPSAESLRPRGNRLMRLLRSPLHSSAASPSRPPLPNTPGASPFRSPLHPSGAAAATPSTSHALEDFKQGVDTWLRQSLAELSESAESIAASPEAAGANTRATTRKALRQAAAAISNAAVALETRLALERFPGRTLPDALGSLSSLQEFTLRGSEITSLPESMGRLSGLARLIVSNSGHLQQLPSSLTDLSELDTLELENVPLQTWPEDIGTMQRLKTLTQTGGKYEHLPDGLTELKNLYRFELGHLSRLRELPDDLGKMQSLRFLTVQSVRRLQSLPSGLTDLPLLRELNLRDNKRLAKLPITMGNLGGLASLSLNGCSALRQLPASIGDLSNLQMLDLRDTGIERLPRSLSRLPKNCRILVPEHLRAQLKEIRNPKPAEAPGEAGPSNAVRRPVAPQSSSHIRTDTRLSGLTDELRRIDEALAGRFGQWATGLIIQARHGQRLTHEAVDLIEEAVAEAVRSETYRSSFAEFLDAHAPRQRNPLDGVTLAVGVQEIEGDARTAYSHLLQHRIMHTQNREEALSLLMEAIQNPDMRIRRRDLLENWDPVALKEQMWPPLHTYVSMHDKKGAAAMDKAAKGAMAAFEKAQAGKMRDNTAKERSEKEQKIANAAIKHRADQLVKEWELS